MFIEYCAEDDLAAGPNGKVTKVLRLPSNGKDYLVIDNGTIAKLVSRVLGEVHDCYVGKIRKESEVVMLEIPSVELPVEHDEK